VRASIGVDVALDVDDIDDERAVDETRFESLIAHLNDDQRAAVRLCRAAQDYALILG
jgi:hypothetical protein